MVVLKRSSWIYAFVFGIDARGVAGFPEPRIDRIPLSILVALFLCTAIKRPLMAGIFSALDMLARVVAFLLDGSLVVGHLPIGWERIRIEPWPRVFGIRISPWIIIGIFVVGVHYLAGHTDDAVQYFLLFGGMVALTFMLVPDATPLDRVTDTLGTRAEAWLYASYGRVPRFLPLVRLIG